MNIGEVLLKLWNETLIEMMLGAQSDLPLHSFVQMA